MRRHPCFCQGMNKVNPAPQFRAGVRYGGSNPSVTAIAAAPAPARVAAWQPSSPYWQAGLMTAAALSAGAVPSCPRGSVPRKMGQNWYCSRPSLLQRLFGRY